MGRARAVIIFNMKRLGFLLIASLIFILTVEAAFAQGDTTSALVLNADGPITPPMLEYLERGVEAAERAQVEVLIIELNTPGGDLGSATNIIQLFRSSRVPIVVFITPNGAMAGSAGAIISMAAHAVAMAPETAIGAASPISGSGEDLTQTLETKTKEIMRAQIRPLVSRRGQEATDLAEAMIEDAKAVSAQEALDAGLIDFIAADTSDLLDQLDGFTVNLADGPRKLSTANAQAEPFDMSFIERFLLLLTDPNITFLLIAIGIQAVLIEIASPGGWVAGFVGVVCISLAVYGMGILPVNWFGIIFIVTAFVLFILDIKAPTHGALTAAGVGSFIVGALVLFNSPGTPQFQRVSVPLVIGVGAFLGMVFFVILGFALRAQRTPIRMGMESLVNRSGVARTDLRTTGQVQLGSELWTAEPVEGGEAISRGDRVEVVEVKGLRLIVKRKK